MNQLVLFHKVIFYPLLSKPRYEINKSLFLIIIKQCRTIYQFDGIIHIATIYAHVIRVDSAKGILIGRCIQLVDNSSNKFVCIKDHPLDLTILKDS